MVLDPILIFLLPIILIVIAMIFDSLLFSFFGGVSAVFAGVHYMDTIWVGMIYLGLGIYFILASAFVEWEE